MAVLQTFSTEPLGPCESGISFGACVQIFIIHTLLQFASLCILPLVNVISLKKAAAGCRNVWRRFHLASELQ